MDALGINLTNLIINLILFGVFYYFIHYYLLNTLASILEKRKLQVDEVAEKLKKAEELAEKSENEYKTKIQSAKTEADNIIRTARLHAELNSKEMIKKANVEVKELISQSRSAMELEFASKLKDSEMQSEQKIKERLKKLIGEKLQDVDIDSAIIKQMKDNG